jgi:hypothetical protein
MAPSILGKAGKMAGVDSPTEGGSVGRERKMRYFFPTESVNFVAVLSFSTVV